MTFTIFSTCKPFVGPFREIQWNAIRSWTKIRPRPEIILFGDEQGVSEIASALGLRHVPHLERNEHGTPYVSFLFNKAQEIAASDLICYVNADIILLSDFPVAVKRMEELARGRPFLGVGRKTSIPLKNPIDFAAADWESRLRTLVSEVGRHVTPDSDYYVFKRGFWKSVPNFAIGRCFWSSWFMWSTRKGGHLLFDATPSVLAAEPRHDYSHATSTGGSTRLSGAEYRANKKLFRHCKYYTTADATHVLRDGGLHRTGLARRFKSLRIRSGYYLYFLLKATWYPYSLPLIILGRGVRTAGRLLAAPFRRRPPSALKL